MTLRAIISGPTVTLRGRRGEEGRCARVEMEILRAVTSMSTDSTGGDPVGDDVILTGCVRPFTEKNMAKIRAILASFLIPVANERRNGGSQ